MNQLTSCPVPLQQLIIDADGSCRLCPQHTVEIHALRHGTGRSTLKQAITRPMQWHAESWQAAWHSSDAIMLRNQLNSGTWPSACDGCRRDELRGQESFRRHMSKRSPQITGNADLTVLEFNLGDISEVRHPLGVSEISQPLRREREIAFWCNALSEDDQHHLHMPKWIGNSFFNSHYDLWCGVNFPGTFSILVNPDTYIGQGPRMPAWLESDVARANLIDLLPRLRTLRFAGGDPLLIPGLCSTFDAIAQHANDQCVINISTMLTQWPQKLMDSLASMRSCNVNVLIEGHGAVDEWMRYQTHWHVTTELLDRLCQLGNINITVNTHVTALNLLDLPRLLQWLRDVANRNQRLITWTPILPKHMAVQPVILPHQQRLDLSAQLQSWRTTQSTQWPLYCWDGIDRVSDWISGKPRYDQAAVDRFQALLRYQQAVRRNAITRKWLGFGDDQDWEQTFPALASLLQDG